ncbi:aldose 1-epimerase family protein [Fibrella aquatilis]|uniref:Aldose 1-epimerase family protein n=1 Tax=Fibrella aquatilis TaxID=2817059 RepID=A0A939G7L0_9BACT|nr:aldose 1-epimerase family protein [Fibrella aquatilis]MBO0932114.1 aldose 1-epimerase family protein [Fibrella aquatilis]
MNPWTNKISHHAQLGGIETAVLDNGAGRGVRVAWINTGTGLRYKVVLDRAMDIAEAFYNEHSLAWLSHSGVTPPQPFTDRGLQWLRTFGGGLLVTCGLSHVGGPEEDAYGQRGLHGLISNIPAEIESIIQPDPVAGKPDFSITGFMRETTVFGPSLELRRTISGTLGQAQIRIHDEVTNRANTPAPHMLLYHLNFGWPLVDEGTKLLWEGSWHAREGGINADTFNDENDFKTCPAPLESHSGTSEAVAIIDPIANNTGHCRAGLHNSMLGLTVSISFQKAQLPWLINWQHWGRGEYVTALEPSTHPLIGQAQARENKTLIFIEPGTSKTYDLVIDVMQ